MEDEQSHDINNQNKGCFSVPEEDVSSTKNKNSSSDGHRKAGNTENALALLQSPETEQKGDSPLFLSLAAGGDNPSTLSNGDVTSPQVMSMGAICSDTVNSQEASLMEQGQMVVAGPRCLLKQTWSRLRKESALHYPMEETLWHDSNRAASQSTKLLASGDPYLNKDGTFKDYKSYQRLEAGAIIYAAMECIYCLEKGDPLGGTKDVFKSKCKSFILKKRAYPKTLLDNWKQLPYNNHVLPLSGVMTADYGYIYQVTEHMDYNLRQARKGVVLIQLTRTMSSNIEWKYPIRNLKNTIRSILKGVIHLNHNKYQHYDLKEENIFVNKPAGCQCNSILECTCAE